MPNKPSELLAARLRYKRQLKNIKNGKNACKKMFKPDYLHNGVREILGEELSQQFIAQVHNEIKTGLHRSYFKYR